MHDVFSKVIFFYWKCFFVHNLCIPYLVPDGSRARARAHRAPVREPTSVCAENIYIYIYICFFLFCFFIYLFCVFPGAVVMDEGGGDEVM